MDIIRRLWTDEAETLKEGTTATVEDLNPLHA